MEDGLLNVIRSTKLFSSLSKKACAEILPLFEHIQLKKSEILFNQGDLSDCLYILLSGKLSVIITTALAESRSIGHLDPGETVGELGALSNEPRSLTVKALKDCLLLKMANENFIQICHHYPAIMFATIHPIVARSQKVIELLSSEKIRKNIAIIPANEQINLKKFADKLAEHVIHHPNAIFLSDYSPEFESITPAVLQEKLDQIERIRKTKHKVIYFLKSFNTPLAKLSFKKIDMIYIVGKKDSTPSIDPLILEKIARKKKHLKSDPELVLVHPDKTLAPTHTSDWLQLTKFGLHHHVRINVSNDYQRLLRFIRGKAIGLVLGGGGTRGWAHLGVLKALREAKIPIDIIGGTSVGAIVAACYAIHQSYEDGHEKFAEIVAASRNSISWKSLTWPAISLFNAKKFTLSLQKIFGKIEIEDLWIPYFCISTNLTTHLEEIHRSGLLWKKTRASASLPGIIPPMVMEGDLHFDGGLLNNLPADIMRQLVGIKGKIIAVELSDSQLHGNKYYFPPVLTFTQALLAKLGLAYQNYKFPHFIDTFMKAIFSGSTLKVKQNSVAANQLISLNLTGFSMLHADVKQGEKMIERGYSQTLKQLKPMIETYHRRNEACNKKENEI
jgi:NTE family protein